MDKRQSGMLASTFKTKTDDTWKVNDSFPKLRLTRVKEQQSSSRRKTRSKSMLSLFKPWQLEIQRYWRRTGNQTRKTLKLIEQNLIRNHASFDDTFKKGFLCGTVKRIAAVYGFALTDEQFLRDCSTVDANDRSTVDEMDMYDDGICELGKLSIHQSKINLAEASNVTNKNGLPSEGKYDQGASSVNCRRETLRPRLKHEANSNNGKSSGNASNDSDSEEQSSNDRADKNDELIVLSGCGRTIEWQFPKQTTPCPVHNCRKQFDIRSDAIEHYKTEHTMKSTLCFICNKPIITRNINDLKWHCKSRHPGNPMDFNEPKQQRAKRNKNSCGSNGSAGNSQK